jgi:hypothetical protein
MGIIELLIALVVILWLFGTVTIGGSAIHLLIILLIILIVFQRRG